MSVPTSEPPCARPVPRRERLLLHPHVNERCWAEVTGCGIAGFSSSSGFEMNSDTDIGDLELEVGCVFNYQSSHCLSHAMKPLNGQIYSYTVHKLFLRAEHFMKSC